MKAAQLRVEEVDGRTGLAVLSGSIGSLATVAANLGSQVAVLRAPGPEAESVADLATVVALTIMAFDLEPLTVQIDDRGAVILIRSGAMFALTEQWEIPAECRRIEDVAYPIEVTVKLRGAHRVKVLAVCRPEEIEGKRWVREAAAPEGGDRG